jgi:propionyl-CoA carboxylase beta chain
MTDIIEAAGARPAPQRPIHENIAAQHAGGKLTARERLEVLLDSGSFEEFDSPVEQPASERQAAPGETVVTGRGTVNGRVVFVYAKDITVLGGTLSDAHARKIIRLQDRAMHDRAPLIAIFDSLGTQLQDGFGALAGQAEIFRRCVHASGIIPQIALVLGPCIAADALMARLCDFVLMLREGSSLSVSTPDVVWALTNERTDAEALGGASVHGQKTGLCDHAYENDVEALLQTRRLVDFLPSSIDGQVPERPTVDDSERCELSLGSLVPDEAFRPYDMMELIVKSVDESDFFEIQDGYAQNIIVGFARIAGRPVGIVANQPLVLGGVLDGHAARKAARFVRFCDAFNIPIVSFIDVPGFLPSVAQEQGGLVGHAATLLFAYARATVPKVSIVTRNGFGSAYAIMGSKHLGVDVNYAWPSALIGLIGAQAAVELLDGSVEEDRGARVKDYEARVLSPAAALENGLIDAIIVPHETRRHIASALKALRRTHADTAQRKHEAIPL